MSLSVSIEHPKQTLLFPLSGDPNSPPILAHHNGSLDSPTANANGNAMNNGGGGGGGGGNNSGNGGGNNGANNTSSSNNSSMAITAGIETVPVLYHELRLAIQQWKNWAGSKG